MIAGHFPRIFILAVAYGVDSHKGPARRRADARLYILHKWASLMI